MNRTTLLISILCCGVLLVVVWRAVAYHRYSVRAKEIAVERSAAEVAFEHCVRSRHREFSGVQEDIIGVQECLKRESAKSPFSVWCDRVGFHTSDAFDGYPNRQEIVADTDGVVVTKFEHQGRVVLFAKKSVKYRFADKEVEVVFEFVVDGQR